MGLKEMMQNSPRYRWFILAIVSVGTFMATLDSSIVNVALPTISQNLNADLSILQWVVTAYLLTISSLLPIFGRVADLLGRKRIYSMGYILFTLGSVLCGLAFPRSYANFPGNRGLDDYVHIGYVDFVVPAPLLFCSEVPM